MSGIEIVVHCYSGKAVPIYHRLLQMQLSSILLHMPQALPVTITICYTDEDAKTVEVVDWFARVFADEPEFNLHKMRLSPSQLFQRAFGRNITAQESTAEVVWFTDCDYVFGDGCLQSAYLACKASSRNIVFPREIFIHARHEFGDALVDRLENHVKLGAYLIKRYDFVKRRERRAIGGIQIVKGQYCRENGYLEGTSWVYPVEDNGQFRQCRCDVPFRKQVGVAECVEIPNLYRIRHSHAGRDGGVVNHGKKTQC